MSTRVWLLSTLSYLGFIVGAWAMGQPRGPDIVGQCELTRAEQINAAKLGSGLGSSLSMTNGEFQASSASEPEMEATQEGDVLQMCLVISHAGCPSGDGKIYDTTNLRTGAIWRLPNSYHPCVVD